MVEKLKYNLDQSLQKIRERSEKLVRKKEMMKMRCLGALSTVTAIALLFVFYSINDIVGTEGKDSFYGSFMISREAGLYVIIGLLCFLLGVTLTLVLTKYVKNSKSRI